MPFCGTPCISVEGLLGSGKNSLCSNILREAIPEINYLVVEEPIQAYQKMPTCYESSLNPLEEFYAAPKRNGLALELWIVKCLEKCYQGLKKYLNEKNVDIIIFERCIDSTSVFVNAMKKMNYISTTEEQLILNEISAIQSKYFDSSAFASDGMIFLDIPLNKCNDVVKSRGRSAELIFSDLESYQAQLQASYVSHLSMYELFMGKEKILHLLDPCDEETEIEHVSHLQKAIDFIKQTSENSKKCSCK